MLGADGADYDRLIACQIAMTKIMQKGATNRRPRGAKVFSYAVSVVTNSFIGDVLPFENQNTFFQL
jgi:hypothetical protein